MSSREAGNRRQSVCWHLCFYIYEARSVFHAYVCISERHGQPRRPSADISVCEHRWILSKSHYTGQNEDAGCENAVAYGYFISPMFFNYLTCSIPFFLDSHFGEKKRLLGKKKKKKRTGTKPCLLMIMIQTACLYPWVHLHNLWPFSLMHKHMAYSKPDAECSFIFPHTHVLLAQVTHLS